MRRRNDIDDLPVGRFISLDCFVGNHKPNGGIDANIAGGGD